MMAETAFRQEEGIGLATAIIAHAALIAFLVLRPVAGDIVRPPERIAVTLSDEVGLVSTAPNPSRDAAPDVAPTIGDAPAPAPEAARPTPVRPAPVTAPERPRPAPAVAQPSRPDTRPRRRPDRADPPAPARPTRRAGGSRLGADFLEGARGGAGTQRSAGPPAEAIGPAVRSALSGAITRQLKPHWLAPQGVDAEQLVTVLAWNLNRDGSLAGTPQVVSQSGINAANRAQANRHAEQAIRAVQLAAPFQLPPDLYDGWKRVSAFRFDKRLSQ